MNVSLRKATLEDVSFLVSAHMAVNETNFTGKEDKARKFESDVTKWAGQEVRGEVKHSITSVIEVDGVSAGRFRGIRRSYELMVARIQLLPDYQGRGIGSELIRAAQSEAREMGLPCRLVVNKSNADAKRLYTRLGFRVVRGMDDDELMETVVD